MARGRACALILRTMVTLGQKRWQSHRTPKVLGGAFALRRRSRGGRLLSERIYQNVYKGPAESGAVAATSPQSSAVGAAGVSPAREGGVRNGKNAQSAVGAGAALPYLA